MARLLLFANVYSAPSHGALRREATIFESEGLIVDRWTIRRYRGRLVDEANRLEADKTQVLLDGGVCKLLIPSFVLAATRPRRFFAAVSIALRVGIRSRRGLLRHFAYVLEACALARVVEETHVDHIHAHFGNSTTIAMLCSVLSGVPYSFSVHGPEEFDAADRKGLVEKIKRGAFVRAITRHTASRLRMLVPAAAPRVHVVGIVAETSTRECESIVPPEARRLVWIGRMVQRKEVPLLLDAAREVAQKHPDMKLVLVGDGPQRGDIERKAEAMGLGRYVVFAGWQDAEGVRRELLAARALVIPSSAEGLPDVVLASLAARRPVIATAVAGIPERVTHGVSGWLIEPGSREALAAAMREAIAAAPARLLEMGEAGRRSVLENHGPERGQELAHLIRRSCKRAAPGRLLPEGTLTMASAPNLTG